jgi:hypothetical protein
MSSFGEAISETFGIPKVPPAVFWYEMCVIQAH